jgi:hypothetical protein
MGKADALSRREDHLIGIEKNDMSYPVFYQVQLRSILCLGHLHTSETLDLVQLH